MPLLSTLKIGGGAQKSILDDSAHATTTLVLATCISALVAQENCERSGSGGALVALVRRATLNGRRCFMSEAGAGMACNSR